MEYDIDKEEKGVIAHVPIKYGEEGSCGFLTIMVNINVLRILIDSQDNNIPCIPAVSSILCYHAAFSGEQVPSLSTTLIAEDDIPVQDYVPLCDFETVCMTHVTYEVCDVCRIIRNGKTLCLIPFHVYITVINKGAKSHILVNTNITSAAILFNDLCVF